MSDDLKNQHEEEQHAGSDGPNEGDLRPSEHHDAQYPTPPVGWRPGNFQNGPQGMGNKGAPSRSQRIRIGRNEYVVSSIDVAGLESARKMNMAAQIVALVSLIIGGVFASSVAVGLAIASYVKFSTIAKQVQQEDVKRALKRVGIVAIVMSVIALVLNAISLVLFMPMVMQIAQTGDYSSLWGGALGTGTGSSNTTWG